MCTTVKGGWFKTSQQRGDLRFKKKGDVVKLRNSLPQDAEKAKNIYELKNLEKFVEEKSSEGY